MDASQRPFVHSWTVTSPIAAQTGAVSTLKSSLRLALQQLTLNAPSDGNTPMAHSIKPAARG